MTNQHARNHHLAISPEMVVRHAVVLGHLLHTVVETSLGKTTTHTRSLARVLRAHSSRGATGRRQI